MRLGVWQFHENREIFGVISVLCTFSNELQMIYCVDIQSPDFNSKLYHKM